MVTIYIWQEGQWKDYLTLSEDSFLFSWLVTEAAISHIVIRVVPCTD